MAPKRLQYSEGAMNVACISVGKGTELKVAARQHGIPYPTLRAQVNQWKKTHKKDRWRHEEEVFAAKADKHIYQVSKDTHQQVTIHLCRNAAGELQAPLLIFPGQRFSYDPLEGFPESHFAKSGNGPIDTEIFAKWLATGFIPAVSRLQKPVVLFADGHSTHLTLAIHQICKDNGITSILYQLPGHSSHIVQPLDRTTFENLIKACGEKSSNSRRRIQTLCRNNILQRFSRKAWDEPHHDRDVLLRNSFKASGIFSRNSEQFDRSKLAPNDFMLCVPIMKVYSRRQSESCKILLFFWCWLQI
ncbi:tigger transposable element-derived protein 6-like protein [Plakobranchus ocellatus]|uniref:Tigger transposable element-derived protein 6-like protein n=1 Tax=Plakobranchus ocellatus TaxID=259542 RepID=A0AAV3Z8V7_9GAST|nr:tigger transposable element-derived protein 6-like protein [Plakobranchus ocellatus]